MDNNKSILCLLVLKPADSCCVKGSSVSVILCRSEPAALPSGVRLHLSKCVALHDDPVEGSGGGTLRLWGAPPPSVHPSRYHRASEGRGRSQNVHISSTAVFHNVTCDVKTPLNWEKSIIYCFPTLLCVLKCCRYLEYSSVMSQRVSISHPGLGRLSFCLLPNMQQVHRSISVSRKLKTSCVSANRLRLSADDVTLGAAAPGSETPGRFLGLKAAGAWWILCGPKMHCTWQGSAGTGNDAGGCYIL